MGLELMGEVPFDVGFALVFLAVRHLAFRPDGFFLVACAVLIGRVAVHNLLLRLQGAEIAHLGHKFHSPLEAERSVRLVGVEMEFGGNFTFAQLPVDQRRTIGGVGVLASVVKAHRAGVAVELEDLADGNVSAISFAGRRDAFFVGIGSDVCRCVGDSPVDVAGNGIQLIYRFVCRSFRTGGQQQGEVPACRHPYRSYLFRVETTLFGFAADHTHSPLAILPGSLVVGDTLRTGGAVYEIYALHAQLGEFLVPHLDQPNIAAVVVTAAGNQDHTRSVGVGRLFEPLQIRDTVLVRVEAFRLGNIRHSGNLMGLGIRHLADRPNILAFPRTELQGDENEDKGENLFHIPNINKFCGLTLI